MRTTRRAFLVGGLGLGVLAMSEGCRAGRGDRLLGRPRSRSLDTGGGLSQGRLRFRPGPPATETGRTGEITLPVGAESPHAFGYVPEAAGGAAMRLVMYLHGAGGDASQSVFALRPWADEHRLLLLAPQSEDTTWDAISGGFGADVRTVDRLLEQVAASYPVDGYTVAGFSDGASYALSLGLGNGDVFDSVIAFSPCFSAAQVHNGRPRVFISHGTQDEVLPIDSCSRQLVPSLRRDEYDVTYAEFPGGHQSPPEIKTSAIDWLTRRRRG